MLHQVLLILLILPFGLQSSSLNVQAAPSLVSRAHDRVQKSEDIIRAAIAAGEGLQGLTYAIGGGAGCLLLGHKGQTGDVDITVLIDETTHTKNTLTAIPGFALKGKNRRLHYSVNPSVSVPFDILAPPIMVRYPFDTKTQVVKAHGVRVLHPIIMLDDKCRVWGMRDKKNDMPAIKFLVKHLQERQLLTVDQIPHCGGIPEVEALLHPTRRPSPPSPSPPSPSSLRP